MANKITKFFTLSAYVLFVMLAGELIMLKYFPSSVQMYIHHSKSRKKPESFIIFNVIAYLFGNAVMVLLNFCSWYLLTQYVLVW